MRVRLRDLVDTSAAVGATRARTTKVAAIAALRPARAGPDEVRVAVAFLSGELVQRQIGVGHALIRDVPPPAPGPELTVAEVDRVFAQIGAMAGPGSQSAKRDALRALLARADAGEQHFLIRLLLGDLSQGALGGVMVGGHRPRGPRRRQPCDARSCCAATSPP